MKIKLVSYKSRFKTLTAANAHVASSAYFTSVLPNILVDCICALEVGTSVEHQNISGCKH